MTPPADAITITFYAPGPLLNLNDRDHWAVKARKVATWRSTAHWAACELLGPLSRRRQPPSFVMLTLPVPDKRRRDPANYWCGKPAVDGLVDAGLWPDDTPEYVTTIEPVLRVSRDRLVTIHIWPRGEQ